MNRVLWPIVSMVVFCFGIIGVWLCCELFASEWVINHLTEWSDAKRVLKIGSKRTLECRYYAAVNKINVAKRTRDRGLLEEGVTEVIEISKHAPKYKQVERILNLIER